MQAIYLFFFQGLIDPLGKVHSGMLGLANPFLLAFCRRADGDMGVSPFLPATK